MSGPKFRLTGKGSLTALLALLAVVALVASGIALWGRTGTSDRDARTEALVQTQGLPAVGDTSAPSALFVGDSYTMGPYALSDLGYACLTAANMGWQCNLGNQPASGYIAGGDGQRLPRTIGSLELDSTSLNERFAHLRELDKADIVILDAGRNDLRFGVVYLLNMMKYTIHRALESWPNARIVVVLPWLMSDPVLIIPDTDGMTFNGYLTSQLRADPEFDNVTLIDPAALGWFANEDLKKYTDADGVHPNFAGHRKIAEYLTEALKQEGFAVPQ